MNTTIQTHLLIQNKVLRLLIVFMLLNVAGCSVVDSYRFPSQTAVINLPKIPEIKRQQAVKPRYIPTPKPKPVYRAPVQPKPSISSSSFQIRNRTVLTQPKQKIVVPQSKAKQPTQVNQQQKLDALKRIQEQAKQKATVDIDPYASIPTSSNKTTTTTNVVPNNRALTTGSSPAVRTLMISARADIAIGRSRSAISKLERGLRIEPQNAQLWHMLARAHFSNSAYLHSISIAKKSNANTSDQALIQQNWQLIKRAGERSGNASAIKEALDYMKLNP